MLMKKLLKSLAIEEDGQDLIEYALVAAIVALGAVGALRGLKNSIGSAFNSVGNTLTNAVA
jgi:pilus assembly protein Flp/PilA